MLIECVNCGFYVSDDESFCPDCGINAPDKLLQTISEYHKRDLTVTVAVVFAIAASFAVLYARSDGKFDNLSELPMLLIGALLIGLAFSVIFSSIVIKKSVKNESTNRFPQKKSGATFRDIEETITMRNFELDRQYRETEMLLERAEKNGSAATAEKLTAVRELILSQIVRYELQNRKIELIRLQNNLRPILYYKDFSDAETKIPAANIDDALAEIDFVRQELTNDYAIEFPPATQTEKLNFLAQLEETKKTCERLREKILIRQTAGVLQNSSPIEENYNLPSEREITRTIDAFNIQASLTDFSDSFVKLEREHELFNAKREIERNFYQSD